MADSRSMRASGTLMTPSRGFRVSPEGRPVSARKRVVFPAPGRPTIPTFKQIPPRARAAYIDPGDGGKGAAEKPKRQKATWFLPLLLVFSLELTPFVFADILARCDFLTLSFSRSLFSPHSPMPRVPLAESGFLFP